LVRKLKARAIEWRGLQEIFPADLESVLGGYWEKELGRLVWPVPAMREVLAELKSALSWMKDLKTC
jgi:hypothetical protein